MIQVVCKAASCMLCTSQEYSNVELIARSLPTRETTPSVSVETEKTSSPPLADCLAAYE